MAILDDLCLWIRFSAKILLIKYFAIKDILWFVEMKVSGEKWGDDLYIVHQNMTFRSNRKNLQKKICYYFILWNNNNEQITTKNYSWVVRAVSTIRSHRQLWNNLIQTNWCKWVIRRSLISILTKSGLSIIESGMQWKNSLMKYFIIPVNYNNII